MSRATGIALELQREALRRVAEWRSGGQTCVKCPGCEAAGLAITDRSARPHTEWYHLKCVACGLDTTIGVPLGSRPPTLD